MAKYIVLDSKFTPMSFAERIAPYQDYYENAYKQQEEIANLELAASSLEKSLEDERDANLKQQYTDYINQITALRDSINTFGVDKNIINEGLKARSVFNSNIVPIMGAQQRRQEAINNWNKDFDKKARYIGNSPLETSITDWMHGATPNIYNIKGSDVAELSKNLTLGVTTDLIDDSDVQKITQGINPDSLNNIIYSMEYDNGFTLTNKEKYWKQHLNNIINAVKADYDFNSLTENQQKQFMKEVYTGILSGNVYAEELKKLSDKTGTKNNTIDLTNIKGVPLDRHEILSPDIRNNMSNKELIKNAYPDYASYYNEDGTVKTTIDLTDTDYRAFVLKKIESLAENYIPEILSKEYSNKEFEDLLPKNKVKVKEEALRKAAQDLGIPNFDLEGFLTKPIPQEYKDEFNQMFADATKSLQDIDVVKLRKSYLSDFHYLNLSNPEKFMNTILTRAEVNAGDDNLSIKKVKSFKPKQVTENINGKDVTYNKLEWSFDEGSEVSLDDFEKDDNGKFIGNPLFSRSIVQSDTPGLLMQLNGEDYFIPSSLFGSIDNTESLLRQIFEQDLEIDEYIKQFEDYYKIKKYYNEETGDFYENAFYDNKFLLLYEQIEKAKDLKKSIAQNLVNNIANLSYTVDSPQYSTN